MPFNKFAAGSKTYRGVSSAPHIGPLTDVEGYAERDMKYRTRMRNNALLKRIQAGQKKRYMSSDYLSAPTGRTL
jgi:hypothetical protein